MPLSGKFILRAKGPYSFEHSSAFYRRSKFELIDRHDKNYFTRALEFENQPILIRIQNNNDQITDRLTINWSSSNNLENKDRFREHLLKMFYLDFDIDLFYNHHLDPKMKKQVRRFTGFRPILTSTIYETVAWSIIGQQVNLQFAYKIVSRLIKKVNRTFNLNGQTYYLFPRPEDIIRLNPKTLLSMQFSQRKVEYLLGFTKQICDGRFDLEALKYLDYDASLDKLLAIRGIGPWSANYILLRGAGCRDAFPVGDSGINRAVKTIYGLGPRPSVDDLLELGERWRPYRSLATYYLWKSL